MTDRELLEAAAKAAGLTVLRCRLDDPLWHDMLLDMRPAYPQTAGWNPLEDDGDALRLACRLKINIEHMKTMAGAIFGVNCWPAGRGDCGISETGSGDYDALTRRAITRAAAEMAS